MGEFMTNLERSLSDEDNSTEETTQDNPELNESESGLSEQESEPAHYQEQEDDGEEIPTLTDMAEAAKQKKTFKVKVDGEELEVDEDELLRGYQLRKASDKKFSEANQARKQAEEFVRLLKTDPAKVLSHPSIGLDLKKFAEDYLVQELQKEMMTPEQREMAEYKQKLAMYEEQERLRREQEENQQQEAVRQKYAEEYQKQIIEALDNNGLPKTEYTVQRMIYYMHKALQNGYELEAKDVTDLVRRDYQEDTKALYSGLDADALVKILGDDVASKIRKHDLSQIKNPENKLKTGVPVKGSKKGKKEPEKLNKDEWRKRLSQIKD